MAVGRARYLEADEKHSVQGVYFVWSAASH